MILCTESSRADKNAGGRSGPGWEPRPSNGDNPWPPAINRSNAGRIEHSYFSFGCRVVGLFSNKLLAAGRSFLPEKNAIRCAWPLYKINYIILKLHS